LLVDDGEKITADKKSRPKLSALQSFNQVAYVERRFG
jgi:hypothetical protein